MANCSRAHTRSYLCSSSFGERSPSNERRVFLRVGFCIHRRTRTPRLLSARRYSTSISVRKLTMAEGGEGEDEIQFLRTVSPFSVSLKPRAGAVSAVTASFCWPCVYACVCEGREFTALRMTAPPDTSHWSVSPHHADCRLNGGIGMKTLTDS